MFLTFSIFIKITWTPIHNLNTSTILHTSTSGAIRPPQSPYHSNLAEPLQVGANNITKTIPIRTASYLSNVFLLPLYSHVCL